MFRIRSHSTGLSHNSVSGFLHSWCQFNKIWNRKIIRQPDGRVIIEQNFIIYPIKIKRLSIFTRDKSAWGGVYFQISLQDNLRGHLKYSRYVSQSHFLHQTWCIMHNHQPSVWVPHYRSFHLCSWIKCYILAPYWIIGTNYIQVLISTMTFPFNLSRAFFSWISNRIWPSSISILIFRKEYVTSWYTFPSSI